jgi:predicted DNA-binding transcriptional regulator AlpA
MPAKTTTAAPDPEEDRLIAALGVANLCGIGRGALGNRMRNDPTFPKPARVRGRLYWRRSAIREYLARIAG